MNKLYKLFKMSKQLFCFHVYKNTQVYRMFTRWPYSLINTFERNICIKCLKDKHGKII